MGIRVAGAPISWGICEVPGWGRMLPLDRVLGEMRELGITATELGAPGFFPDDTPGIAAALAEYGIEMLGGFVPLILQDPAVRDEMLADARRIAARFAELGASKFITAAILDLEWSARRWLEPREWRHLVEMLDRVDDICAEHGLEQVIHPHWNTAIEQADDVNRLLDTSEVRWCLDTGHLALGGTDPLEFARQAGERVTYVHLKDLHHARAGQLIAGAQSIMAAVQGGMFCPLGAGDLPIEGVVNHLVGSGFDGWFVIEQDTAITGEDPPMGSGPVLDVRQSVEYLRSIRTSSPASAG